VLDILLAVYTPMVVVQQLLKFYRWNGTDYALVLDQPLMLLEELTFCEHYDRKRLFWYKCLYSECINLSNENINISTFS
jgi:hypothetical protein